MSTATQGEPTAGEIFHVELRSADTDGTRKFMSKVFGWEFTETPHPAFSQATMVSPPGARMPTDRLDLTFAAPADPTRREILSRLAEGDASVSELAKPFTMSLPAISRHLKVLGAGRADRSRPRGAVATKPDAGGAA